MAPSHIASIKIKRDPQLKQWVRSKLLPAHKEMDAMLHALSVEDNPDDGVASDQFQQLANEWISETMFVSNITKKCTHPAYQRIIGMGEPAVTFILNELRQYGPRDWFWALTAITGENPITEEIAGNMKAMSEAWLQWGTRMGYLSDSQTKTKKSPQTSNSTK